MSSLTSSQSSLQQQPPPPSSSTPPEATTSSRSSSFTLPSSIALTASSFLRRFYSDASSLTGPTAANNSNNDHNKDDDHRSTSTWLPSLTGAVYTPPRRHGSPFAPPPLHPLKLKGFKPASASSAPAQLLSRTIAEEIRSLLPPRLQLMDEWNLAYSLEHHGVSLATLYNRCAAFQGSRAGFVIVVKDGSGGLFGAYLTDPPHPSAHFYGTGECFLWRASTLSTTSILATLPPPPSSDTTNLTRATTLVRTGTSQLTPPAPANGSAPHSSSGATTPERIRFKAFPYSGVNDYLIFCEQGFLSVGGGDGHYGLWVDDSFEKGISSSCPTFGNEPLSDEGEKFDILGVEVWSIGT